MDQRLAFLTRSVMGYLKGDFKEIYISGPVPELRFIFFCDYIFWVHIRLLIVPNTSLTHERVFFDDEHDAGPHFSRFSSIYNIYICNPNRPPSPNPYALPYPLVSSCLPSIRTRVLPAGWEIAPKGAAKVNFFISFHLAVMLTLILHRTPSTKHFLNFESTIVSVSGPTAALSY
jgi:hypothetical protein